MKEYRDWKQCPEPNCPADILEVYDPKLTECPLCGAKLSNVFDEANNRNN